MIFSEYNNFNKQDFNFSEIDFVETSAKEIENMEIKCKKILAETSVDEYFKNSSGIFNNIESYIKYSKIDFNNKSILEFGAGNCKMSAIISKLYNVNSIDCVDMSKTLLTEIAPRVIKHIGGNLKKFKFIICDMNKIDLLKKKYDIIICYSVVHHLQLPEYFFHYQLDKITHKNSQVLCLEEAAIPYFSLPFSGVSSYKRKQYDLRCSGDNENVYTVFKYKTFFQKKWDVKNLHISNIKNFIKRIFIFFSLKGFSYNFILTKKNFF
tara:strand:- start:785 stop:1582 length:798 start_codon:yes stop_codon:yes gene_type:complete